MTPSKNPTNEQDLINNLLDAFKSDTIDAEKLESVFADMKEINKRKIILSNYKIGYIKKQDLYYIRLNGKLYRKRHKKDLEDLIVAYEKKELNTHLLTLRKIYPTVLALTKREKEDRTWTKYEQYWTRFFETYEVLIDKPLDKITRMDGYLFFDHVKKTLGGKIKKQYWLNIKSFANRLFESDEAMNIISKNPWATLRPGKWEFEPPTHHQKGTDVFNETELSIIRSEIWMEVAETAEALPLSIILLAGTGMRIGEISALTWEDIEDNSIRIHKKIVPKLVDGHMEGYKLDTYPKTEAGNRTLLLNSECIEVLNIIKQLNEGSGYPTDDNDLIFWRTYHGKKGPSTPRAIDNMIRKICRQAGIIEKSSHDMRRTVLTQLSYMGMPLAEIQAIAGHASIEQTLKYIRRLDGDLDPKPFLERLC